MSAKLVVMAVVLLAGTAMMLFAGGEGHTTKAMQNDETVALRNTVATLRKEHADEIATLKVAHEQSVQHLKREIEKWKPVNAGALGYQVLGCGGRKGSLAHVGIAIQSKSVAQGEVACTFYDAKRLNRCLQQSYDETPAEARLEKFVIAHHEYGGKVICGLNNDAVTAAVDGGGVFEPVTLRFLTTMVQRVREEVRSVAAMVLSKDDMATLKHEDNVEFLDAGMNLASLSIPVWGLGTHVRGFEAMPMNVQLLKMSKCMNYDPGMPPFEIVHSPLSNPESRGKKCQIISHHTNIGDGIMHCFDGERGGGYVRRGIVTMKTLDEVASNPELGRTTLEKLLDQLPPNFAVNEGTGIRDWTHRLNNTSNQAILAFLRRKHRVMKIDVEGHEILAMEGASKLLSSPDAPIVILSEIWKIIDMVAYARLMRSHGYRLYMVARTTSKPNAPGFVWIDDDEKCTEHHKGMLGQLINVVFVKRGAELLVENLPHAD